MGIANSTSIFKGAIITVSMRWTDRLIGFVSTLLLARLLIPEDFGIIAMASLVIGLVDVFLALGVNVALIQNRNPTSVHYDTAWTLRLIQTTLAALIVCLTAPQAADYFHDPRIGPVLFAMAFSLWLTGLENIGVITFQKEMRFGLDFYFTFLKRIVGFGVTILLAWMLNSYWALVCGTIASRAFGALLSYRMSPMRPRFSFAKIREIFSVSQWMLINGIGVYLNRNLHKIIVGRRTNATVMGGYTLADEISAMPSTELLAPLNRVLFPAFVEAKHDLTKLKQLFLLAQGVQSLLGIAMGVGLALVVHEVVLILLGEKWLFIAPFVQLLALANVAEAIATSGGYILITLGKSRNVAFLNWIQLSFFAIAALFMLPTSDVLQIAWLRMIAVLLGLFLSIWILIHTLSNLRLNEILSVMVRPLIGAAVMAIVVIFVEKEVIFSTPIMLIIKIVVGIFIYSSAIILMWLAIGKPKGAESYLLDKLFRVLQHRKWSEKFSHERRI